MSAADISQAAAKVKAIPEHLEKAAQELPVTSAIHLYLSLARFFASQFDNIVNSGSNLPYNGVVDTSYPSADWWRALDVGPLDPAIRFDMGFLGSEELNFDLHNFDGRGILDKV